MAKSKKENSFSSMKITGEFKQETIQAVIAIVLFVCALLAVLASFDKAGFVGHYIYMFGKYLFGIGYFLFPILLAILGISFLKGVEQEFRISRIVASFIFFFSGLGIVNMYSQSQGGVIGTFISGSLISLFDTYATLAILLALLIISVLVMFEAHFTSKSLEFWNWFSLMKKNKAEKDLGEKKIAAVAEEAVKKVEDNADKENEYNNSDREEKAEEIRKAKPIKKEDDFNINHIFAHGETEYVPPPLSLLEKDKGKPVVGDIKANANIIKRTLLNFGIDVEMDEISIGPSVTRYALKPAEGVKLAKIVALNSDLALALAAHPVRIEAPIPGKSLVGIEIPNQTKTMVGLASLLSSDEYTESEKPLLISLGKGISGKAVFANLAKAPHMLIAGTTGSGKSVTIHTLITSLLYRNSPYNMKFIFIDPKRVELTLYNKIPHLLTPVITDAKKAIFSLRWAAQEMSRRYDILEKNSVRDIESYHKNVLAKLEERDDDKPPMPYIVIVIDELADIMQTYPRELESAIVRLAQMSRAVGIHLILSTQRPSVNVITGLIKANIPTRVALQVSSQIDSRTILDAPGAEKLLGAGDMLYQGGDMSKPLRIQSAFISENEVKSIVDYLSKSYENEALDQININPEQTQGNNSTIFQSMTNGGGDEDLDEDDLYEDAKQAVIESKKASTSFLQRKLGIGYSRAAKLIDKMEAKGVVGPANGSKPRDILVGGESPISDTPIEETVNDETNS